MAVCHPFNLGMWLDLCPLEPILCVLLLATWIGLQLLLSQSPRQGHSQVDEDSSFKPGGRMICTMPSPTSGTNGAKWSHKKLTAKIYTWARAWYQHPIYVYTYILAYLLASNHVSHVHLELVISMRLRSIILWLVFVSLVPRHSWYPFEAFGTRF